MPIVQPCLSEFGILLEEERSLVDAQRLSPYTALIVEADALNDNLIHAIIEITSANTRHYEKNKSEAAIRLSDRVKSFGKVASKSYEEETVALSLLIADLSSSKYIDDVNLLGLLGWIGKLEESVNNMNNLLRQRNDSMQPFIGQDNLKTVRRKIDKVYHQMVKRINAAAELDDKGEYDAFIDDLNTEISYFNEHTHRTAKKDLGEANYTLIEPIGEQLYTGSVITPIPVVRYQEEGKQAVILSFTKDFTLAYKNNIKPGMAELIVKGKGLYTGKKITTFTIVEAPEK
jgi:hypothetical protein